MRYNPVRANNVNEPYQDRLPPIENSRADAIRSRRVQWVANNNTSVEQVLVERVIDHVHVVGRVQWPRYSVDGARERRVCDAEWCLPDLL